MKGSQIVIHCAAIAGIDTVIKKPTETMRVNMIGTANVLEAAKGLEDLHRFVDFSTSEVFGQSAFRAEENHTTHIGALGEARWTYAVSKLAEEHLAIAYYQEKWLPTAVVRPFNVYGPGQVGEGALRTFVIRALKGEPLEIHGNGTQIRAWCYVDDIVEGVLAVATASGVEGQSLDLGTGQAHPARQVVERIWAMTKARGRILPGALPYRPGEVMHLAADANRTAALIGWRARVGLEEGLRHTIEVKVDG